MDKSELLNGIREVLTDKLSLQAHTLTDSIIRLQLTLDGRPIGKTYTLSASWYTDSGHGGGSYVDSLIINEV